MAEPEFWLRGPIAGVSPLLQPAAHALLQAREDVGALVPGLTVEQIWTTPGGAASVGFHLKHLAGALDRLFTYARGEALTAEQLHYLKSERAPGEPPADGARLVETVDQAIEKGLAQLRATPEATLGESRKVGRQGLGATVLGLLFHGAEHTTRHAGQAITTAKIVRATT